MVEIQRKYTDPVDIEEENRILKKYMGRQFDALEAILPAPAPAPDNEAMKAVQASVKKMEKSVELIDKSLLNVIDARIQNELKTVDAAHKAEIEQVKQDLTKTFSEEKASAATDAALDIERQKLDIAREKNEVLKQLIGKVKK